MTEAGLIPTPANGLRILLDPLSDAMMAKGQQ